MPHHTEMFNKFTFEFVVVKSHATMQCVPGASCTTAAAVRANVLWVGRGGGHPQALALLGTSAYSPRLL